MFAYFVALVPPCWDVRGLGYECVFSHGYTSKWHFLFDDDGYRDQLLNGVYLNEIKSLDQQAELLLTGGVVRVTVGGLFGGLAGQETLRMEIPPG